METDTTSPTGYPQCLKEISQPGTIKEVGTRKKKNFTTNPWMTLKSDLLRTLLATGKGRKTSEN